MSADTQRTLAATAGLALVGTGAWWLSPPASLITVGLLLIGAAVWGHYHARPS